MLLFIKAQKNATEGNDATSVFTYMLIHKVKRFVIS